MTDALLDQIEQALRGAIPGPWDTMDEKVFSVTPVNGLPWLVCETPYDYDSGDDDQHLRNAHLIAHAPEWLQALVGRLRALEAERDGLVADCTRLALANDALREFIKAAPVLPGYSWDDERKKILAGVGSPSGAPQP